MLVNCSKWLEIVVCRERKLTQVNKCEFRDSAGAYAGPEFPEKLPIGAGQKNHGSYEPKFYYKRDMTAVIIYDKRNRILHPVISDTVLQYCNCHKILHSQSVDKRHS